VKMFDAGKTIMTALPYGEKNYDNTLSHFHTIPERNGRTDGRTDLLYQYRASVCFLSFLTTTNLFVMVSFWCILYRSSAAGLQRSL